MIYEVREVFYSLSTCPSIKPLRQKPVCWYEFWTLDRELMFMYEMYMLHGNRRDEALLLLSPHRKCQCKENYSGSNSEHRSFLGSLDRSVKAQLFAQVLELYWVTAATQV